MKTKIIGSNRASIEITIHKDDLWSIDFYTKPRNEWQRVNVPTVILVGKQVGELKEWIKK